MTGEEGKKYRECDLESEILGEGESNTAAGKNGVG